MEIMEITDNNNPYKCDIKKISGCRNIYFGAILIFLGVIWLLDNFSAINHALFNSIFSWQMLIMVIGGYLLSLRNWISGGLVTGIGLILFCVRLLGVDIPMEKIFIPLILITIGSIIIGSRFCKR